MPKIHKHLGIGALVDVTIKNLWPKDKVDVKFPNASSTDRVLGCEVLAEASIPDRGSSIDVLRLGHDRFGGEIFYVKPGACKLKQAGPADKFFNREEAPGADGLFLNSSFLCVICVFLTNVCVYIKCSHHRHFSRPRPISMCMGSFCCACRDLNQVHVLHA